MSMKRIHILSLVTLGLALALPAGAQDAGQQGSTPQTTTQQNGNNGAEARPAYVEEAPVPSPLPFSGEGGSLSFGPELERSNYLRGGVSVGANFDDNALNTPTNHMSDLGYSIQPFISFDQARARLRWNLAYAAGFIANQRTSVRNQASHNLSGELSYRLSPHVDLHLRDAFLVTTGFFDQFQSQQGLPVTGPINQPNQTVITPLAKVINNTSSVDLKYRFTAGDMIGGSGTFYQSHFRDLPQGAQALIDTESRGGDVFYTHRFTPRNWSGIAYKYQRLTFTPGPQIAVTHSAFLFHTIYLQPNMTFSVYAGPERASLESQTIVLVIVPPLVAAQVISLSRERWSGAGGASYAWQGLHTSVRMNATRRVTDGGGLQGAVTLNSVDGAVKQQVSRSTAFTLAGVFGDQSPLGGSASGLQRFKSASGTAEVEQRLGANLLLRFGYGRDYLGNVVSTTGPAVNHNRGFMSLSYSFVRPMGR